MARDTEPGRVGLVKAADLLKLTGELRRRGVAGTVHSVMNSLRARVERRFDARYGIDSVQWIPVSTLSVDSPNKAFANLYGPTPAWLMPRFLESIPEDLSGFTFVDFGSGKGRALLLAGRHRFRRVTGVEFSRELHAEAIANIEHFRKQGLLQTPVVESVNMDVVDFAIPDGECVLYTYNPFGPEVMRRLLANIACSIREVPRRIYFIYYDCVDAHLFEASGIFREMPIRRLRWVHRLLMPHDAKIYVSGA